MYIGLLDQVKVAVINISDPSNITFHFDNGFDSLNLWPRKSHSYV